MLFQLECRGSYPSPLFRVECEWVEWDTQTLVHKIIPASVEAPGGKEGGMEHGRGGGGGRGWVRKTLRQKKVPCQHPFWKRVGVKYQSVDVLWDTPIFIDKPPAFGPAYLIPGGGRGSEE